MTMFLYIFLMSGGDAMMGMVMLCSASVMMSWMSLLCSASSMSCGSSMVLILYSCSHCLSYLPLVLILLLVSYCTMSLSCGE